jgi:hypothetical protein
VIVNYILTLGLLRFQIPTATTMKMTVFLDVESCSQKETDRRFGWLVHHLTTLFQ